MYKQNKKITNPSYLKYECESIVYQDVGVGQFVVDDQTQLHELEIPK